MIKDIVSVFLSRSLDDGKFNTVHIKLESGPQWWARLSNLAEWKNDDSAPHSQGIFKLVSLENYPELKYVLDTYSWMFIDPFSNEKGIVIIPRDKDHA